MLGEGFTRKTRNGLSARSVMADRLGRTTQPPVFAGVSIEAPDRSAAWGIAVQIANGEYDYPAFRPEEGDTVIDIGANVGLFSLWAQRRGASLTAYEPAPATYDCLVRNVKGRSIDVLHAAVVGVAPPSGTVDLFLHDEESVCNTLVGRDIQNGGELADTTSVPAIGIADVLSGDCDLLKVDCEGAEFEILRAASDEVLRRARRIILEFHRVAGDPAELVTRLQNAGFETTILDGEDEQAPYGVLGAVRK